MSDRRYADDTDPRHECDVDGCDRREWSAFALDLHRVRDHPDEYAEPTTRQVER